MKFKLQLFNLNTKESIVDYLKSIGEDSSMDARKKIASNLGIEGYSGTYDQNVAMLKMLQGGSSGNTVSGNTVGGSSGNVASAPSVSTINGVDQDTLNKMNSTFTASDKVNNAQAEADAQKGVLKEISSVTDIIGQDTWDAINKKFEAPSAYTEAMNLTNSLRQQLTSGRTSYSDQIDAMIAKIQNRDAFEYDVDSDMLFQQYLASSMASGKTAMQDTMGQAAALTGGYGSTYSTSVGNQAYNAYLQDAYNNLPEYYQMAMEAYQMEGEEMYNQLAMLSDADSREYERLFNAYSVNNENAQDIYNKAYGEWQDSVSNAFNSAGLQLQEHGQLYDQAYNTYKALQDNAQNMYNNEYTQWADEVNNAYKYAGMLNSDYWNNEEMTQRRDEFKSEMDYKYKALEQEQNQFNESMAFEKEQLQAKISENVNNVVVTPSGEVDVDNIPSTISKKASSFSNNGDLEAYLDNQVNSGALTEAEADYLYSTNMIPEQAALNERDWTMIDDGGLNLGWGIDRDGVVRDQYNTEYTMADLFRELKKTMSASEARDYIKKLQESVGITE